MDKLTVTPTAWRGAAAWIITGDAINVVVTEIGGHLAAIRRNGEDLNPLWQPPWTTADPATVKEGGYYGDGPETLLMASIVGHNLCMDRFGSGWPGENKPMHGEVGVLHWKLAQPKPDLVEISVTLPLAKIKVRRRIKLEKDSCHYVGGVFHDGAAAKEVEWAEHATIGDPFLAGARMTAGIDKVFNGPSKEASSRFPAIAPEGEISVEQALSMPAANDPPCGDIMTGRVTDGWWVAENPALKRRLTYHWNKDQFPWVAIWTQHLSRTGKPWCGKVRTRGLEISTKAFPEGQPPASRHEAYQGRPSVCRVPPGKWLQQPLRITWEAI